MKIRPARSLTGEVALPGDKSISHRTAILGSIAAGETRVSNYAASEDCASSLRCVEALGAEVERGSGEVRIFGRGKDGLSAPAGALDCGNSGTTARLLSGVLAGQPFAASLDGDSSLRSRPMGRVIKPLEMMGARVVSSEGRLPMTIEGRRPLRAVRYVSPVASAQVKSCVLLAGLFADGDTSVQSPASDVEGPTSRNHTELMLRGFGADVRERVIPAGSEFVHEASVSGASVLEGIEVAVPGDVSASAFFLVAAACLEGSLIRMRGTGLNPTRTAALEVLKELGADISLESEGVSGGEPFGDVTVRGGIGRASKDAVIEGSRIANLIDELPVLAVFGTRLESGLEVRDAAELRHKESDRIAAVVTNLRMMGADIEEKEDGFVVGRSELKGARLESFGDHRIAMAFAVAALLAEGESEIVGAECAGVSFPDFFKVLNSVVS